MGPTYLAEQSPITFSLNIRSFKVANPTTLLNAVKAAAKKDPKTVFSNFSGYRLDRHDELQVIRAALEKHPNKETLALVKELRLYNDADAKEIIDNLARELRISTL